MSTAVRGIDIIYESKDAFCKAVIVLESNFHQNAVLFAGSIKNIFIQGCSGVIQVRNEFLDTAFVVEGMVLFHAFTQVEQIDLQTFCQERSFAETLFQNVIFENCFFENLIIGQEMHESTSNVCFAHNSQRSNYVTSGIFLFMDLTIAVNLYHQPFRQSIYNGRTNAVQTAGNLISAAAEFTTGMKDGKYHLQGRHAFLLIDIDRDTTAIIHNGNGVIGMDFYSDFVAEASQSFVNGVIYDFINQMMQTSGTGGADIHTGTLADCLQTFQDLNLTCIIFG